MSSAGYAIANRVMCGNDAPLFKLDIAPSCETLFLRKLVAKLPTLDKQLENILKGVYIHTYIQLLAVLVHNTQYLYPSFLPVFSQVYGFCCGQRGGRLCRECTGVFCVPRDRKQTRRHRSGERRQRGYVSGPVEEKCCL